MNGCQDFQALFRVSRRALIKVGAAGFAGLNLPSPCSRPPRPPSFAPKAKHVIFLHQWGGPSHLDTFDMKPEAPSATRSEFKQIDSDTPGIRLTEHLPRFSRGAGPVRADPGGPPHDGEPQLGGVLQPAGVTRPRPTTSGSATPWSCTRPTAAWPRAVPAGRGRGPSIVCVVSIRDPRWQRHAPARPRASSARPSTLSSSPRDPNGSDFRLAELSLPASLPLDRLDDRRGLLGRIDAQNASLGRTATRPRDRRIL